MLSNGVVTKYVYGRGLIGEQVGNTFKIYHFDFRGSTVAITNGSGTVTDTFAYDTYGKCISRTGTSDVIFGYNGKDGVVTDKNGLIYMRARYYSPGMKRFINADIVAGDIGNAITLNRFAYANGNPVSLTDPFALRTVIGTDYAVDITDSISYAAVGKPGTVREMDVKEAAQKEAETIGAKSIGKEAPKEGADDEKYEIKISMNENGDAINRISGILGLEATCDAIAKGACDQIVKEFGREFVLSNACVSKEILDHIEAYNWAVGKTKLPNWLAFGYSVYSNFTNTIGYATSGGGRLGVLEATKDINVRESEVVKADREYGFSYWTSQAYIFDYKNGIREEYIGTDLDPWASER